MIWSMYLVNWKKFRIDRLSFSLHTLALLHPLFAHFLTHEKERSAVFDKIDIDASQNLDVNSQKTRQRYYGIVTVIP